MVLGEPYTVDDLLRRVGGSTSEILASCRPWNSTATSLAARPADAVTLSNDRAAGFRQA